jgi:uncharacterized protein (TIGR02118 family)
MKYRVAWKGTAMIRLTYVLSRLSTLSREDFQRYWRETHGPLVAKHATTLGCRKYIQAHTLDDPLNAAFIESRGLMEPYDGMDALWWNTREELQQALSTPAGQRAAEELLDDERQCLDWARSSLWFAIELPQVNPTPETLVATEMSPLLCIIAVFRHLPTLSFDDAQLYWRMQHGPKLRAYAHVLRIRRYLQVHMLADPLTDHFRAQRGSMDAAFTGHAEVWWDRQEWAAALTSPEGLRASATILEDERAFVDFSRSAFWVAKEHVFIDRP